MTNEQYTIAIRKIMESGRSYQAIIDLTTFLKNYNDTINETIEEVKSERRVIRKICHNPETSKKEKLEAVINIMG